MISSTRPIKLIHVSSFDGSRSLWSRWITHASDYRSLQQRLQMRSGNPHCKDTRDLAPASGLSHHHSFVVTAPPCSLFDARAASAPFFAPARRIRPFLCPPPSPPPHTMQVALHPRSLFFSMCSTSFPGPPPSPSRGVHSSLFHFLRHLPASDVDLPLRVAAHRVLFVFALLTIALY